ncbi:NAD-dependent epimerase/dehydratase family protein [Lacrimispora brassicae]
MKILITGAAGFIGSSLSAQLLKLGNQVIGVDNYLTGRRSTIDQLARSSNFRFIEQDVIEPLEIEEELDWVMHFASPASPPKYLQYPLETLRVNSEGTMHLLKLANRKGASFFFASTSEIYGDPLVVPQSEKYWGNVNCYGPRSCYDEAKRYAEAMIYAMNKKYKIPIRVIRIFNTYGPNMDLADGRVVTNFMKQIIDKTPITVYGDGSQTRCFQYIDDLISGILKLMDTDYQLPVNFGNQDEFRIIDLVQLFSDIEGRDLEIKFMPLPEDDPKRRKPDISIARTVLDWEPQVRIKEGLIRTLNYYRFNQEQKE